MLDPPTDQVDLVALADDIYDGVAADPAAFGPRAAELVVRARNEGQIEALVVALRAQAWAERLALQNVKAVKLLDQAVRLAERAGLSRRLGELLVTRVAVLHELGRFSAAQHDVDRATDLLPDSDRAQLVFQQGVLLFNLGRISEASTHYRRVLADADCPPLVRAKAGNNLAHLESELGHADVARALLETAGAVAAQAGRTVSAYVAQTRAWVEVQAGRLAESLVRFDEAQRLWRAAELPLGYHYLEYSEAMSGLRLLPEALAAARESLDTLSAGDISLMAAEAQLHVARLCLLVGDLPAAAAAAEHGGSLMRRQRRAGWAGRALLLQLLIASRDGALSSRDLLRLRRAAADLHRSGMRSDAVEAHLLAGRLTTSHRQRAVARDNLLAAERLSRGTPVLVRLRGRLAAALLAELDADSGGVLMACRAGLLDLDRYRRALPTMELRALASSHGAELGELGLRALRATATPARVFSWLERTRAAALAPLDTPADDGVEHELAELRAAHAELVGAVAQGEAEPPELLARVAAAEVAVRRASWSAPTTSRPAEHEGPPTAARVREQLKPMATTLVEYGILDGELLATVLDGRRTRLVELGAVAAIGPRVDSLLFALRRLARPGTSGVAAAGARRSARAALAALREQLVSPLGLDPAVPLIVVPVGELQRLPWAPLHPGPTTVAPSAAVWLRSVRTRPAGGAVVLVAGPDLPAAPRELADLRTVHPSATTLLPPASTCHAVVDALKHADLAHFACHGRLRADNPAFSALLLTDGPLTVHELSRRAGAPRRVVLAACESGAQVSFPGDEALGFVSALLAGGSDAVLASGVLVNDEQTLPLMLALHERLAAGSTMADALWTGRQGFDPDDPAQLASWCAFDAYGGG